MDAEYVPIDELTLSAGLGLTRAPLWQCFGYTKRGDLQSEGQSRTRHPGLSGHAGRGLAPPHYR